MLNLTGWASGSIEIPTLPFTVTIGIGNGGGVPLSTTVVAAALVDRWIPFCFVPDTLTYRIIVFRRRSLVSSSPLYGPRSDRRHLPTRWDVEYFAVKT
jgi:hypothetical protein